MTGPMLPDELSAIAADDALLDDAAVGVAQASDIGALLATWQRELDAAATDGADAGVLPFGRSRRWRRQVAGGVAAVVVLAASTGVAAAANGPSGPLGGLHRFLYGTDAPHRTDATVAMVQDLLDSADLAIETARRAGGISAVKRAAVADDLTTAQRLLDAANEPPSGLDDRLADLRAELTALLVLTTPADDGARPDGSAGDPRNGDEGPGAGGGGDGSADDRSGDGDGSGSDGDEAGSGGGGSSDDGSGEGSHSGPGDGSDDGSGSGDQGSDQQGSDQQGSDQQGSDQQGSDENVSEDDLSGDVDDGQDFGDGDADRSGDSSDEGAKDGSGSGPDGLDDTDSAPAHLS